MDDHPQLGKEGDNPFVTKYWMIQNPGQFFWGHEGYVHSIIIHPKWESDCDWFELKFDIGQYPSYWHGTKLYHVFGGGRLMISPGLNDQEELDDWMIVWKRKSKATQVPRFQ